MDKKYFSQTTVTTIADDYKFGIGKSGVSAFLNITWASIKTLLSDLFVSKESGKGLSTNDFDDDYKLILEEQPIYSKRLFVNFSQFHSSTIVQGGSKLYSVNLLVTSGSYTDFNVTVDGVELFNDSSNTDVGLDFNKIVKTGCSISFTGVNLSGTLVINYKPNYFNTNA